MLYVKTVKNLPNDEPQKVWKSEDQDCCQGLDDKLLHNTETPVNAGSANCILPFLIY